MIKVAITGGIGSGKTTVSKIFENLGVPVYYTDIEIRRLMNTDIVKNVVTRSFGNNCYNNNTLNPKYLSKIVFNDKSKLALLNSIVFPYVLDDFNEWLKSINTKYVLIESAILFETGFNKFVDKIILVVTDLETRIERVIKRDNTNRQDVIARINNQLSDEEKVKLCDFLVDNNIGDLDTQVKNIHEKI